MTRTSSWCRSAALAGVLLWGATARGDAFQRDYEGALASYKQERYAEAIARFQRAFERRPLPRLLINIGRAHLKLGDAQRALVFFNRYLETEKSPDPFVKDEVERDIARAWGLLAKQKEAELPSPPTKAPAASSPTAAPAAYAPLPSPAPMTPPPAAHEEEPPAQAAPPEPLPPASAPQPSPASTAPPTTVPPSGSVAFLGREPDSLYAVSAGGQVCTTPCSLLLPPGPARVLVSGAGQRFRRSIVLPEGPTVVQVQHFTRSRVIAGAILLTLSIPLSVGAGLSFAAVSTSRPGYTLYGPAEGYLAAGSLLGAHALSFFIAGVAQLGSIKRASVEVLGAP